MKKNNLQGAQENKAANAPLLKSSKSEYTASI